MVITTDTCPIDSRALGVGWVAWFGFPCYGPALRVGRTKQKSRGRARAIATTGALCSPALGEPGTYPAVSGGGGRAENRNAPNDTTALSFVGNSEAARYVFVAVVIGDALLAGRRYHNFVLACGLSTELQASRLQPGASSASWSQPGFTADSKINW